MLRSEPTSHIYLPTFWQHQKVYSFCQQFVKGKVVIDIGCGEGYGAKKLAQVAKKVIAVDVDQKNNHRSKTKV